MSPTRLLSCWDTVIGFPQFVFLSGNEANMLACYANAGSANAKLVSESGRIRTKLIGHEHGSKMLSNFLAASACNTGVLGSVQRGRKLSPNTGVLL